MAFDYSPLLATARALIAQFGQTATLRRVTGATYDPVTGTSTGGTTVSATVSAAIVGISEAYAATLGGSVQIQDKMALISDSEPLVSDTLLIGSDEWGIVSVQEVNPGGTALLWKAQVRK